MPVSLTLFSSRGFESWDIERPPLIPEAMPVLIDDDLAFEDGPVSPRSTTVVNRWLRELPTHGAPAPSSWANYARVLRSWMDFLAVHGVGLFDSRERLKQALGRYAEHRAAGPMEHERTPPIVDCDRRRVLQLVDTRLSMNFGLALQVRGGVCS
jgi:hypothetical protein